LPHELKRNLTLNFFYGLGYVRTKIKYGKNILLILTQKIPIFFDLLCRICYCGARIYIFENLSDTMSQKGFLKIKIFTTVFE